MMDCMGSMSKKYKCSACKGSGRKLVPHPAGGVDVAECDACYGYGYAMGEILCEQSVKWIRSTQFAGDHPYCAACAIMESDFMKEDSYTMWVKIENYKRK
jgi:hypothetical protein